MVEWFGDIYGRYYFLVPPLLERWKKLSQADPTVTLAHAFFGAATMEDPSHKRHLPVLDEVFFKPLLLKVWIGTVTNNECAKFVPYGILKKYSKEWSCEYVRRKYFFHPIPGLFNNAPNLPHELDLARTDLQGINWRQLQMSRESSRSGFPVEAIWQTEFYGSNGQHIPRKYIFCKEYATSSGGLSGSVDFVLRNGQTRANIF